MNREQGQSLDIDLSRLGRQADLKELPTLENQVTGLVRGHYPDRLEYRLEAWFFSEHSLREKPVIGQFFLAYLNPREAVLARIISVRRPKNDLNLDYEDTPPDFKKAFNETEFEKTQQYFVTGRVLGVIRQEDKNLLPEFIASQRRIPPVNSLVTWVSGPLLNLICGNKQVAETGEFRTNKAIGCLSMGEYVYAGEWPEISILDSQIKIPTKVGVRFDLKNLVSHRTFVFAKAGYGKSNLAKVLFTRLYEKKNEQASKPIGTLILDADGEYFFPNGENKGLCSVPGLRGKLVVFSKQKAPPGYSELNDFVWQETRINLRNFTPKECLPFLLSADRLKLEGVKKLLRMEPGNWGELLDSAISGERKFFTDDEWVEKLLGAAKMNKSEINALRAVVSYLLDTFHTEELGIEELLLYYLRTGHLCVLDGSSLRGEAMLGLSAVLMNRIFTENQYWFSRNSDNMVPIIMAVEEAQLLFEERHSGEKVFTRWVKEGRKYKLGMFMVTQQPGALPEQLLSQGDNWFVFHLLGIDDLRRLEIANAHFSEDILRLVMNEPIRGQGYFWSSASAFPYPIPFKALDFNKMVEELAKEKPETHQLIVETPRRKLENIKEYGVSQPARIKTIRRDLETNKPGLFQRLASNQGLPIQELEEVLTMNKGLLPLLGEPGLCHQYALKVMEFQARQTGKILREFEPGVYRLEQSAQRGINGSGSLNPPSPPPNGGPQSRI